MAWNAPANAAFRSRVAASGPWSSATLHPGTISAVVWEQGSSARQTTAQACLMTLAGPARSRLVVGNWLRGRVARWSFAGAVSADKAPGGSNVKLLADGRVTKIYRR
ncbi:hypothetical protein Gocc_1383 [Gaiella occulta]|uniref:Uncharacterized protein n=2 Tax=Gaiella occulta TaxID=1002870 RepID=A0A7M2YX88_9ACTN|nr:hypothetical protein Gocc_1383 [Gaiella occulta]